MDYMASMELAIRNEKTEREFYLNEASRSKNALAKKMFSQLAEEENEHMERIHSLHGKLVAEGSWPADVPLVVGGTDIKKVLSETVSKGGSSVDHDDDDIKALKKAIGFEAKGSELYADMAAAAETGAEREFFEFLSGIEREHKLSLEQSLAYLEDPEAWSMEQEKSTLDGA